MDDFYSFRRVFSRLRQLRWEVEEGKEPFSAKCYISGPMTGLPDFNAEAFHRAAHVLRTACWNVYNPVENDAERGITLTGLTGQEQFDLAEAMKTDLWQVCDSDAVFVLPGWEESKGAKLEVHVAVEVGVPVYSLLSGRLIDPGDDVGFSVKVPDLPIRARDIIQVDPEHNPEFVMGPTDEFPRPMTEDERLFFGLDAIGDLSIKTQRWEGIEYIEDDVEIVSIPLEEYESEQRQTDSGTGGQKGQKLARFDLVPWQFQRALARHYGIGALKYDDDNWRRGYAWDLSIGAAERHLNAFKGGESVYLEKFTGRDGVQYEVETHHLIALAWQAATLYIFERLGLGSDRRHVEEAA